MEASLFFPKYFQFRDISWFLEEEEEKEEEVSLGLGLHLLIFMLQKF